MEMGILLVRSKKQFLKLSYKFWMLFGLVVPQSTSYAQHALTVVSGYAQGTTYQVKYLDPSQRRFHKQIDSLLKDFDASLSLYREDSELSLFNRSHAIRFSTPYFYPVLKKAEEVYRATGGLFDPTVKPLIDAYGFGSGGRKEEGVRFDLDSVMQLIGFNKIEFDERSVQKAKEHVQLDFNAIAQGYSVDVIAAFLEKKGIYEYLIEVGGELRGRGAKPDGTNWVVGISDPTLPTDLLATITINDRAMATSGNYRNHYVRDGITYTHIVNPITGQPGKSDILSVTVFADDAITADAYATAFLLMGADTLKSRLKEFPELDVFVAYSDSHGALVTYASPGLSTVLKLKK